MVERAPTLDTRESVATGHREQTEDNPRDVPGVRSEGQAEAPRSPAEAKEVKSQQERLLLQRRERDRR